MKLLTQQQRQLLINNWNANQQRINQDLETYDFFPVVKLFTPDAQATWILTEMNPDDDIAFGLCDLGLGCPELGYVSIQELSELRGPLGLKVERDLQFKGDQNLSWYVHKARGG